jgi:hypothetical protein
VPVGAVQMRSRDVLVPEDAGAAAINVRLT